MPEEALQAAFEIKTACDEISRRLLRWHWEQKPGSHSLDALLRHIAQRQKESPDYYDRMPDLSGKTSWQQLDTTLCMRVLLDPEKDAAKPLDLLGNTRHPGAARRACNAVRTAALLFNEAIESLEEGYADTAFRENELAQYYREAESFLEQCGARKAARPADNTRGQSKAAKPAARTGSRASGGKASNNSRTAARKRSAPARRSSKKKRTGNRTILTLLLVVLVLGLLLRALHMGVL